MMILFCLTIPLALAQTTQELLSMPCPNLCNGQGWCDHAHRRCECYDGFTGPDCSLRTCPWGSAWADDADDILVTDNAHNPAECSRRGTCNQGTGQCICDDGWEGAACERKSCSCSGNGRCVSMEYFATLKDPGEGTVFSYETNWDAKMMYGCLCDEGFSGYDCSLRECPRGDDPLTTGVTEIQQLVCTADGGTFLLAFAGQWTTEISYRASTSAIESALEALSTVLTPGDISGISVTFSAPATEFCDDAGATTAYIEFLQNYGDLPLVQVDASGLTLTSGTATVTTTRSQTCTKENDYCANRGICDHTTGTCTCSLTGSCFENCFATSDGFGNDGARGDCGHAEVTVDACPGEVECNEHGVCDATTFACDCQDGYTGADCSIMTCPQGLSWFSYPTAENVAHQHFSECSDMGLCNRDFGECECATGYEGAACQYMSCPGDGTCSGHGECLSMALLAEASTLNGVATSLTYGATPNDPVRWDFEAVRGCHCNDGYTEFDCSGKLCPFGDDPNSKNQFNEIQLMNCDLESSSGTNLVLTFREETATIVARTATLADLETALESMATIDDVKLYFGIAEDDDTGLVCSNDGTDVYVEFLRPTGDVPLLSTSEPSTVAVSEFRQGTKEWEECSGRGLCSRADGACTCFEGYGSSDGQGSPGPYADCGNILPVIQELLEAA